MMQNHTVMADLEKTIHSASSEDPAVLQTDLHDFVLVPQPSHLKDDPLNWPHWLKWLVLIQTAFLAMLGTFNSAVVNPVLVPLAKHFDITTVEASYQTTAVIVAVGICPLFWTPLANVYGRRPIYLLSTLIGILGTIGTGFATKWSTLLVARVISGLGVGAPMAIGPATVNDMFFAHERGMKMGIWTVFLTNGAHVGPIIGGYLAQSAGYKWCYFLPAVVNATTLAIMIVALPETLFLRSEEALRHHQERTYTQMLFSFRRNAVFAGSLHPNHFVRPFKMLKYPSISLTFVCYTITFGFCTVLPGVTAATLFTKAYHFQTGPIGLALGLPLLIGSALGELMSGRFSDWMMYLYAKRHDGRFKPEARLPASFASILFCPAGIIIYGVTFYYKTHWIGPMMGMAIASFGLQLVTTVTYTYCSDCYKPQSGDIGSLYNFGRQTFSFPMGFYAIPFANAVGIEWAWTTFALITVVAYGGIILLVFKGEEWRKGLGEPEE